MGDLLYQPKVIVTRVLEYVVTVLTALMVLVVLWGVFTRFVLLDPSRWSEQVAKIFLVWVALLGAAPAFSRNEHLGIDYFSSKLTPAGQKLWAVVAHIVVIAFACWAMVYGGWILVSETLSAGQLDPALQVPVGYLYSPVMVSGLAIVLVSLQQLGDLLAGNERRALERPTDNEYVEAT
jgi:TRAP-type C4-dicarboxylate transport system permease small subunit